MLEWCAAAEDDKALRGGLKRRGRDNIGQVAPRAVIRIACGCSLVVQANVALQEGNRHDNCCCQGACKVQSSHKSEMLKSI